MPFRPFLLLCLLLLSSVTHAQWSNDPLAAPALDDQVTFLPVEEAYILNIDREEGERLRLNWQIAEGYYLYRHSFKFALLDQDTPLIITPDIAQGLEKHDEYFGDVEVYYHYSDVFLGPVPSGRPLSLRVTSQGCADAGLCYPPRTQYFDIDSTGTQITEVNAPPAALNPAANTSKNSSLPYILLLALLGGAVLNLMPCVFPVLSLKVLGFANDKHHHQSLHGLSYTAGVVASFIVVAALLISLRSAGQAIGWGFQLQTPWFVAALTYLFFVMGLSLSGFVDIGGQWMGFGDKLASSSGYQGSFFTGVLATIVASPCTAPFMGTALGYAMTQSAGTALLVFATLGLGMALPVLLLSCSPRLLGQLPKPGQWMDQLKQFLAFPLYAAALWLCWVVGKQAGVNGMLAVLAGCLLLTLTIWLWHRHILRQLLSALCAALAISLLSSSLLSTNGLVSTSPWQTYSPKTLAQLRSEGKPVFINLTADWCLTCLANEKLTLGTEAGQQAFIDYGIHYLKGDWTNRDPVITELLEQHGRTGVPLYLLYPSGQNKKAVILPQLLTPDILLEAFKQR